MELQLATRNCEVSIALKKTIRSPFFHWMALKRNGQTIQGLVFLAKDIHYTQEFAAVKIAWAPALK